MFSICPKKVFINKELSGTDIRVYLILQGFADEKGFCFPSIAKIADIIGVSRRTVERSLNSLEKNNAIIRKKRIKNDGGYTSNAYYLKLEPDDDTKKESQGIRQESRKVYDNNVVSNNNHFNNNNFNLNTRAGAREELGKDNCVLRLDDLNDVKSCLEQVKCTKDFNFFITSTGNLACRPKAKYINQDANDLIYDFFYYKCAREIKFYDFNEHALRETLILI